MMKINPIIEEFLQDNVLLLKDGDYDKLYEQASKQDRFEVSKLTQFLWNCDIHPEDEGLTQIPDEFAEGLDLKTFRIPLGIKNIGDWAFSDCLSLTSVTIPEGITSIGYSAFWGCTSLTSITISSGVESIGKYTFYGCTSLKGIIFNGTKEQWDAVEKGQGWRSFVRNLLVLCKDGDVRYD